MKEIITIQPRGHTYRQWTLAILANATVLTYALQSAWVSPMTKILQSEHSPIGRPLTYKELSWVGNVPSLMGMMGAAMAAFVAEKYGRRVTVMTIAVVQALCWILKLVPSTIETLLIARICCGLAGGCYNIVPIYVKEICQTDIRGKAGVLVTMSQNIGYLFIYALGSYVDYYTVIWIGLVVPVMNFALMFIVPESPVYLMKVGKYNEAAATIANLRGLEISDKMVLNEIDTIKKEDEAFKLLENVSFISILKQPAWRRAILLMVAIIFAHASNGTFTIITYASSIMKQSGVTMNPELQSLSIPVFMIIASAVSMNLVEKLGRKPIIVTTFIVSAIALSWLGSILLLQQKEIVVPGWMPIVAIVACVFCYAAGVSPLPFVIMSEVFNFQVRTKVMCCLLIQAWLTAFLQLVCYTQTTDAYGTHVSIFIFAAANVFGTFCTLVFLPETKGKTVEDIENDLMKRKLC